MARQTTAGVDLESLEWTYGDRLRKARRLAGLGVEEMAKRLGRDRNSITRYEQLKRLDRVIARAYAQETGAPLWWLEDRDPDSEELRAMESAIEREFSIALVR